MEENKVQEELLKFDSLLEGANYLKWLVNPLINSDIITIESSRGSGSSLVAAYIAYQEHLRGTPIYSNLDLDFAKPLDSQNLDNIFNSCILWNDFPVPSSRLHKVFPYFLIQYRKRNNTIIAPNPIDPRLKHTSTIRSKVVELRDEFEIKLWYYGEGSMKRWILNKKCIPKEVLSNVQW